MDLSVFFIFDFFNVFFLLLNVIEIVSEWYFFLIFDLLYILNILMLVNSFLVVCLIIFKILLIG